MNDFPDRLQALLELRRHARGVDEARAAIAAHPDWARGYAYLSYFLWCEGYIREAREAARTGIGKDPADAWLYVLLADAQHALGRAAERDAALREAICLDPTYAYAYRQLSVYLYDARKYLPARRVALDGLRHVPEDAGLLRALAWAEHGNGRSDVAVATIERALRHAPLDAVLWYGLAVFLRDRNKAGDRDRAREAIAEAVRLAPTDYLYRRIRDELE